MKIAIIATVALLATPALAQSFQKKEPPSPTGQIAPGTVTQQRVSPLQLSQPKPKRLRIGPAERTNQVSGESRADFNQARARGGVAALVRGLYVNEKSDNPCEFNINQTSYQYDPTQGSGTVYRFMDMPEQPLNWAMWGGCDRNRDGVGAGPGGISEINLADGDYITGLRVCTNNRNNDRGRLVKGVEVRTATIGPKGRVKKSRNYSDGQPNCKSWKNWSSCPAKSVASDVIIHWSVGIQNGQKSIVGLELECMDVRYTSEYLAQ